MADKIRILALGGLDADGKNLYVVEINDQIFIVGCGLGYPDKSTPGVDYVIPDISYLKKRKDRVKGYILQDCQDTNLYGIPFIYNEIPAPIYTTSFAKEILYSFMKYIKRNDVELDIRYIDPNGETEIDGRKFSFFSITHSNPFTFGFAIDTTEGNIIFSGDFIIEYNRTRAFQTNINRLTEIVNKKPTYLLLADSANAGRKGFTSPSHRSDIHLKKAINDAEGRIYVAAYSQNMYILVEIIQNCLDSGRLICFFDKDTEFLFKILNLPYFDT
jgi:ribonuclease J